MKAAIIKKNLQLEYIALWEASKKKQLESRLDSLVKDAVRAAKRKGRNGVDSTYRREPIMDPLLSKLHNYGNNGGWGVDQLHRLSREIYNGKVPPQDRIDFGKWISVELECIFINPKAEQEFAQFVRKEKITKFVTLKDDGSIKTENEKPNCDCEHEDGHEDDDDYINHTCGFNPRGREIVITFKDGDWAFVQLICAKLRKLKTRVNKSCGLHVHFDCRHLDPRGVSMFGRRIAVTVPALKQILPLSRRNNRFCNEPINSFSESDRGGNGRYTFVNLQSYARHKTLEIRGHSGTIDATKIINWIRIIKIIMSKPNRKPVTLASELITKFKLPADLVEYVSKRFDKFNPVTSENSEDDVAVDHATYLDLNMDIPQDSINIEEIATAMQARAEENRRASANISVPGGPAFNVGQVVLNPNYEISYSIGSNGSGGRISRSLEQRLIMMDDGTVRVVEETEQAAEAHQEVSQEVVARPNPWSDAVSPDYVRRSRSLNDLVTDLGIRDDEEIEDPFDDDEESI